MRIHKGYRILLGVLLLGLLTVCGCGKKETQSFKEGTAYTRGEWIEELGERFGYVQALAEVPFFMDVTRDMSCYDAVQACAEWEVIDKESQFFPGEEVTWEFAVNTAVRAMELERVENAGYVVDAESIPSFFTQNIAQVELNDWSETVTREEAEQILSYVTDFEAKLVFPQVEEVVFAEGVQTVTEKDICLKGDGKTAIVLNSAEYSTGDVLYMENSVTGEVLGLCVENVQDNLFTYSMAEPEEVFETFSIHGTYEPDMSMVTVSNVEQMVFCVNDDYYGGFDPYMQKPLFTSRDKYNVESVSTRLEENISSNSLSFRIYDTDGIWTAEAGITDLKVDVDFDIDHIKDTSVRVTYNDYIRLNSELHSQESALLGTVKIPIKWGLNLELSMFLNMGLDGEAEISYSAAVSTGVYGQDGKGIRTEINNDATLTCEGKVTAAIEPTIKADLTWWFLGSIVNAKVTTGVVASVKIEDDILDDKAACCDILIFVPLRWAVNEDSCRMTDLIKNAKISRTVWDSTNSPFQWRWHYEDDVLVEKCTRGDGDEVEAPSVTEEGKPLDEYKMFDFEEISFGMLKLTAYNLYLEKGESLEIPFADLPDNVTRNDLVYEVIEQSNVCSVGANGVVTANDTGATNIKISTEDDKYTAYLTVIVAQDYHDTSTFIPLQ